MADKTCSWTEHQQGTEKVLKLVENYGDVENCRSLLERVPMVSYLDTPGSVKMIVQRLSKHLRLKWKNKSS